MCLLPGRTMVLVLKENSSVCSRFARMMFSENWVGASRWELLGMNFWIVTSRHELRGRNLSI